MTESIILALLALLPAVVLMIYIYKKDRIEKEPKGLLAGLFLLGCVSVIPAVILELLAQGVLNATGIPDDSILYKFLEYFFGVALIEEGCKLFFVYIVTRKSKHFNCLFDGVVYAVFVSLGFAVTENLFYVFENGIGVALLRMVTSIPGHCFFGIIMGYFYGRWFLNHKADQLESYLYQYRLIAPGQKSFKPGRWVLATLTAPTAVHGFYDFSLSLESAVFILAFFAFLIALIEGCCAESVEGLLGEGNTSVGTKVEVEHLAASPVGASVLCKSTLTAADGRRLTFEVEVYDNAGLIGKGRHTRFTVDADRFVTKAYSKL